MKDIPAILTNIIIGTVIFLPISIMRILVGERKLIPVHSNLTLWPCTTRLIIQKVI